MVDGICGLYGLLEVLKFQSGSRTAGSSHHFTWDIGDPPAGSAYCPMHANADVLGRCCADRLMCGHADVLGRHAS